MNALSREIAETNMSLGEAEYRLAAAQRIPFPKEWVQLVSGMGGAFSFAMIFGGDLRSAIAAAVAGLAASGYLLLCGRYSLPGGFQKITTASLITLVCILLCQALHTSASHAIIGALMILTPGIAFTMGIRDFVHGDYLSGTIRMIDALLIAASIAIGTGLVLSLYSLLTGWWSHDFSHQFPDRGADGPVPAGRHRHPELCHPVRLPPPEPAHLCAGGCRGLVRV